ncbi:MAG TPA: DNA translocase FtsK [Phycisphaerales bacterium]|nr:DNA translocase FtsK [Phycisphaerales bacterium]HIN84703.1 DNA translocase FtsK [Phycisphaerales bacterium]
MGTTAIRTQGRRLKGPSSLTSADLKLRILWISSAAIALLVAVALLSFDVGDAPSHVVATHNDPISNWCGAVGAWTAYWTYHVLGFGIWVLIVGLSCWVTLVFRGREITHTSIRALGFLIMAIAISCFHDLLFPNIGSLAGAKAGLIAKTIVTQLTTSFSNFGAFIIVLVAFSIGLVVGAEKIAFSIPHFIWNAILRTTKIRAPKFAVPTLPFIRFERGAVLEQDVEVEEEEWEEEYAEDEYEDDEYEDDEEEYEDEKEPRKRLTAAELKKKMAKLPVRVASNGKTAKDSDIQRPDNFEGYIFPSLDLLEDPKESFGDSIEELVRQQAVELEETLQMYGIDGEVAGIEAGPTITLYSIELAPGTKVSSINGVASDIARSLGAPNIRIVPNTAGRKTVGIEVPNLKRETVCIKELMSSKKTDKMKLPMFLGKDASGEPMVEDLTKMPHMLVAGTTGSGKSVCINSIIAGWMYTKRPDELKLILVDPKMVELSQFSDIPHLACPVVTEMNRAAAILEWAVARMEERYQIFRKLGVRDLVGYNELTEDEIYNIYDPQTEEERARIPVKLPYIVFIIDELADLMMTAKDVEQSIVRIAQKARAVGIHLILATQRPEAKVVTGLIKSNMPCRVAFKVNSGMDSRIVLDTKGAELLLGNGDMLYISPGSTTANRSQGTFVSPKEIRSVVKHLKEVAAPNFERSLIQIKPNGNSTVDASGETLERDDLFDDAVRIMIESGRGSVSLLQRRMGIGYGRASRLVDQMAVAGIVGEHKGSVAREILISLEDWDEMQHLEAEDEPGLE